MVIGLMGGVGSGKSTVLNYLQDKYDAYIIQTDYVAKEIMEPGSDAFKQIAKEFPTVIEEGKINSAKLAQVVFSDKEALVKLNSITHPATIKEVLNRVMASTKDYIVVESALLIGTGIEAHCDEIWFVYCDKDTRINRLISNRGYSKEKAESIIANQISDEEFEKYSNVIIDNSGIEQSTYKQIDKFMKNKLI